MSFSHLDHDTLSQWQDNGTAHEVVDIRDPMSFSQGHIPGSYHLDNTSVGDFVERTPQDSTVVVVCYHGHSSQQAALWLAGQGFAKVYSLEGGFTHWQHHHPEQVVRDEGAGPQ
ncbi:thiosulfate sulfurtransferase GlpE [Kushneria phyllosphaerae]|uniref:Thiosulfate sulfurtransferase GlpE n=1 Tax=Kushneria phyllosphaerae TaxID=2100822 RepID=A0A2R8CL81_9GAMM|nr:thiosulfate sulfurtransferase GlpE [Kushneria phyllosphaerae]SPJ33629.1 Thiosulfate sulfurtransferase GlpE [Kushneria phyllosphaerae]